MTYQVTQIIQDVRLAMGLNLQAPTALILSDEQLTLDQQITAKITEAVKQAHIESPAHWLVNASSLAAVIEWNGTCGTLPLPSDWLRLVSFRMSDWEMPVIEPITVDSTAYAMQRSAFPGVRGTPEKPVCAITPNLTLEFYSCRTKNAGIDHALYMPMPAIRDNAIDIAPRCYSAVIDKLTLSLCGNLRNTDKQ